METALREVQTRFKAVVENLDDGLVISDTEGNLLSWNPAALKMHGYSDSEECPFRLHQFSKFFKVSTLDGAMLPIEEWPLARVLRGRRCAMSKSACNALVKSVCGILAVH